MSIAEIIIGFFVLGSLIAICAIRDKILRARIEQLIARHDSERKRWDRERTRWFDRLGANPLEIPKSHREKDLTSPAKRL